MFRLDKGMEKGTSLEMRMGVVEQSGSTRNH